MTAQNPWPQVTEAEPTPDPDPQPEGEPSTDLVPVEPTAELEPAEKPPAPMPQVRNLREVGTEPVLPGWLRDRQTFSAAAQWAVRRPPTSSTFHGVRTPVYGARAAFWLAPIGFVRIMRRWGHWAFDWEGHEVRKNIAGGKSVDATSWVRQTEQHNESVKGRLFVSAAMAAGIFCGAYYAIQSARS